MKTSSLAVIFPILLLIICTTSIEGNILHDIKQIIKDIFSGDEGKETKEIERVRKTMAEWRSCLGQQLDNNELKTINEDCDEEFDIDEEKDTKKKSMVQLSACYRVCQLEHLGWLHDVDSEHTSGPYFNHTAMGLFVNATFPESIQSKLRSKISGCARAMDSFSDEHACKNYKPFFKCLDKSIHDKCKKKRSGKKSVTTVKPTTEEAEEEEATTAGSEDTEDDE